MYIAAKQASILNIRLVFNKYAVEDTFLFSMQFCPGMACPALPTGICIWSHDKLISSTESIYLVKGKIFVGTRNRCMFFIKNNQQL